MTNTTTPVATVTDKVRAIIDQFGIVTDAELIEHLGFTPGGTTQAVQDARRAGHDIAREKGLYFIPPDPVAHWKGEVRETRYNASRTTTQAGRYADNPYAEEAAILARLARDFAEGQLAVANVQADKARLAQLRAASV